MFITHCSYQTRGHKFKCFMGPRPSQKQECQKSCSSRPRAADLCLSVLSIWEGGRCARLVSLRSDGLGYLSSSLQVSCGERGPPHWNPQMFQGKPEMWIFMRSCLMFYIWATDGKFKNKPKKLKKKKKKQKWKILLWLSKGTNGFEG